MVFVMATIPMIIWQSFSAAINLIRADFLKLVKLVSELNTCSICKHEPEQICNGGSEKESTTVEKTIDISCISFLAL